MLGSALLTLGVLVTAALLVGRLVALVRVPRVTGYLLAGVLLGPSLAHLVGVPALLDPTTLASLTPVSNLALALIVFSVGGHFRFVIVRRWRWRIAVAVTADVLVPLSAVALATWLAGAGTETALFLGVIAAATAPASTLMVVREYEADGELSHVMTSLLGLTTLIAIVVFQVVAHVVVTPDEPLLQVTYVLGAPAGLGILAGFVISTWEQRVERVAERQLIGLAVLGLATGAAAALGISTLLTALLAGIIVANAAPHESRIFGELEQIDYPLYVPFFALAGASLHLDLLPRMGVVGAAYVLARAAGKLAGNALGARLGRFGEGVRRWLGTGMLAQAGVAVGFAAQLRGSWGAQGARLETVVLASVLVFEIVGPVLTRLALVRAGEVSILTLLGRRAPVGVFEGMHEVLAHFRDSLGIPSWHKLEHPGHVLVEHIMRRNVETLRDDLPFTAVLEALGHSRYDRIPVVDADGKLTGQICYGEISTALFDDSLEGLVVAKDLAARVPVTLRTTDTLEEALPVLAEHRDVTYIPVVDPRDGKRLRGVVRYNDVLAAYRRLRRRRSATVSRAEAPAGPLEQAAEGEIPES